MRLLQQPRLEPLYNTMMAATRTGPPAMFEPPGALTDMRHEVWIAAGGDVGWGGCEVWASLNGSTYRQFGAIAPGAVVGALTSPLAEAADPDTTSSVTVNVAPSQGEIYPEDDEGADLFTSLCWVDGELLAYTAATLVGPYEYRLNRRIRRGVFGTVVKAHASGARFARLNNFVWRHPYPKHLVGQIIYVKLPSFNPFGQHLHGLDEVEAYQLLLTGAGAK